MTIFDVDHDGLSYRGYTLEQLRVAGIPETALLAAVKSALKAEVDEAAERLRLAHITPGAGQAMEYVEAQRQAQAAHADPNPVAATYPMLAASVGIDKDPSTGQPATDVAGVARSVLFARDAWMQAGSAIRGARLATKAAIDAATTVEAAQAVVFAPPGASA